MRARWLKPEFFRDRKMGPLGPIAALTYQALWVVADDGGTAPCDPDRLKGELFFSWPDITEERIAEALDALETAKRIRRYVVGDDSYAIVHNFSKHQKVHKPSAYRNPKEPKGVNPSSAALVPEDTGTPHHLDTYTPRLLDTKTPRNQELPSRAVQRGGEEELASPAVPEKPRRSRSTKKGADSTPAGGAPKEGAASWLAPTATVWEATFGPGTFNYKKAAGILGKLLAVGHPPETIAAHVGEFIRKGKAEYGGLNSLHQLCDMFGQYAPPAGADGTGNDHAARLWRLVRPLLDLAPHEVEAAAKRLARDDRILWAGDFVEACRRLSFPTLRDAQNDAAAVAHVRDRISLRDFPELLAPNDTPEAVRIERATINACSTWKQKRGLVEREPMRAVVAGLIGTFPPDVIEDAVESFLSQDEAKAKPQFYTFSVFARDAAMYAERQWTTIYGDPIYDDMVRGGWPPETYDEKVKPKKPDYWLRTARDIWLECSTHGLRGADPDCPTFAEKMTAALQVWPPHFRDKAERYMRSLEVWNDPPDMTEDEGAKKYSERLAYFFRRDPEKINGPEIREGVAA